MSGRIIVAKAATEMNGRIIIAKPLSTSGGSSLLEDSPEDHHYWKTDPCSTPLDSQYIMAGVRMQQMGGMQQIGMGDHSMPTKPQPQRFFTPTPDLCSTPLITAAATTAAVAAATTAATTMTAATTTTATAATTTTAAAATTAAQ